MLTGRNQNPLGQTIQFLILANSIRQRDRCIAGKELVWRGANRVEGIRWLRLADRATEDGAVPAVRTRMEGGKWASLLEVVELEVEDGCGDENHPEDIWLVNSRLWRSTGNYRFEDLKWFADQPETLWHESAQNKSVSLGYVPAMSEPASLYLIRLERSATVEFWKETGSESREKTQMRMQLVYRGRTHDLAVTDPLFTERHEIYQRAQLNRTGSLELPAGCYVCVSLTREWKGRQYKIAATIFEPDA